MIPMSKSTLLFAAFGVAFFLAPLFAATEIVNPRVNGRPEAVGVETDRLVFSWNLADQVPETRQCRYRLLLGTSDRFEPQTLLWDSGRVESGRCVEIPYAGKALASSSKYFWTVEIENNRGETAKLTKPASLTTGILKPEDWQASWITIDRTDRDPLPIFRKPFAVDPNKTVANATVHICGLGHYELHLNGQKVGDRFIDPGWTNYRKSCLYSSYDLTDRLGPGENVFGVLLGNGMHNVPGGRYVKFQGSFGLPKLIAQLHVRYTDGSEQRICTDASWRGTLGPITFSCVYGGEDVDERREQPGWGKPGFDEAQGDWQSAKVVDGPGGTLVDQEAPPVVVAQTLRPESLKRLPDGRYIADFGYNFSGRPRVVLQGKAGQTATVKTAEIVDRVWGGHSYTTTLRGEGNELLLPKFTYFGFQFLYIEGAVREEDRTAADAEKPTLVSVEADLTTSSAERIGSFECSDELFNEIDAMIDRSVRSNLQSVLTDCPHREKLGWLEVPHLMGPAILSRYDVHNLYRKTCRDMSESQLENGHVPDIAPEYTRFSQGFFESPEWGSACVQIPWLLYRYYDDTDILRRSYPTMKRYAEYLRSIRNEQGLVKAGLGDWYDWSEEKGHVGYSQHTPGELTATAIAIDDFRKLKMIAELCGKAEDAAMFEAWFQEAARDYSKAYLDPTTGQVATGSQSALAETLFVFGYAKPEILDRLVGRIESDRYKPTVGEVSFPRLIRSLVAGDRNDVLWKLIHRTDKPGYGYMLKEKGMKTLSETWDGPGSSMNHCMFGHIQEWFSGTILGIETRLPGEATTFRLSPQPVGTLAWAKGHYDSVYGRVESSWKLDGARLLYRCVIPANTTAEVVIPTTNPRSITLNGKPVGPSPLTLGGGTYEIEAQWEP